MSADNLTGCKNQSLRGLGEALIGGLLEDTERFEMDPHRVRGIGQASVSKRVGRKQISEFVMNHRLWNRQNR